MAFVHLHNHSHYSLLDSTSRVKPMVAHAKELGFDTLAITDHGNLYGAIEFYQECQQAEIKPIIGQEVYIAPNGLESKRPRIDDKVNTLILLAKNFEGYKNLMQLTTIAYKKGFHAEKPRMDLELLSEYSEGLIVLSGSLNGELPEAIVAGNEDKAREIIAKYKQVFAHDYYLEVQHHPELEKQTLVNLCLS